jgi:hypothetical protein
VPVFGTIGSEEGRRAVDGRKGAKEVICGNERGQPESVLGHRQNLRQHAGLNGTLRRNTICMNGLRSRGGRERFRVTDAPLGPHGDRGYDPIQIRIRCNPVEGVISGSGLAGGNND